MAFAEQAAPLGECISSSEEATAAFAAALAERAAAGTIFLLRGELGAGKTVFVRGAAAGLNVPGESRVASPTYVLLHVHAGGRMPLYHLDLYRLRGGAEELEASGLSAALRAGDGLACVEWPERLGTAATWPRGLLVDFEHLSPRERRLTVAAVPSVAAVWRATVARAVQQAAGRR